MLASTVGSRCGGSSLGAGTGDRKSTGDAAHKRTFLPEALFYFEISPAIRLPISSVSDFIVTMGISFHASKCP